MKLGPVTKLDTRNNTTSKKFDNDVMLENYDIIMIWFFQSMANLEQYESQIPHA